MIVDYSQVHALLEMSLLPADHSSNRRPRLFCSDLDGTLLGDPAAVGRFAKRWWQLAPNVRPVLVYNSGRTVADMRALIAAGELPPADHLLGGVGTEIFSEDHPDWSGAFTAALSAGWNRAAVARVVRQITPATPQPESCQSAYKSSWFWPQATPDEIAELRSAIARAGLSATLVYSSARDLDLLSPAGGKDQALRWLCARLGLPLSATIVAGDTGNDASMLTLPEVRGLLVANCLPELRAATALSPVYLAAQPMADGVIEGLEHYGVFAVA